MTAWAVALLLLAPTEPAATRDDVLVASATGGAIGAAVPIATALCAGCLVATGDSVSGSSALGCAIVSYGCLSSGGAAIGAVTEVQGKRGGEGAIVGAALGAGLGLAGTGAMIVGAFASLGGGPTLASISLTCSGLVAVAGAAPTGICISTLMTDDVAPRTKRELPPKVQKAAPTELRKFKRPPPPPLLDEMQF